MPFRRTASARTLLTFAPLQSLFCSAPAFSGLPLLGFVEPAQARAPLAPPPTRPPCVHSHRVLRPGFGNEGAIPHRPVPSSWFLTTSTASSARKFAGLLHPAASPGVRRVSSRRRLRPETTRASYRTRSTRSPRRLFTPLEEFHPTAAVLRHRSRCPPGVAPMPPLPLRTPPLPATHLTRTSAPDLTFKALLRSRVRNAVMPLPAPGALSFLGFAPLQGPSRSSGTAPTTPARIASGEPKPSDTTRAQLRSAPAPTASR